MRARFPRYDVAVIGGGTAGQLAAIQARRNNKTVVLIERDRMGGDCLHTGCVPTKSLLASARVLHLARRAGDFGLAIAEARVDFPAVMRRKDAIIAAIAKTEDALAFRGRGIDVRLGAARIVSNHEVEIDGERLEARCMVLATGSRPAIPQIDGLQDTPYLTNVSALHLQELPESLIVLGGGPIGCEFAQMFARFGVTVTLLTDRPHLLAREDSDIAAMLEDCLRAEGVALLTSARATSVACDSGRVVLAYRQGDISRTITGARLLVATGRTPNVEGFGLEELGLRLNSAGGVAVDKRLQTSAPSILAAGDVIGGPYFTHWAAYQGRLAGRAAAGRRAVARDRLLPWVTFTDPEVAHVGLGEAEARDRYGDRLEVVRVPFSDNDRAVCQGETDGMVKVLITRGLLGRIVGAQIIGPCAGELIHEVVASMRARVFPWRIAQAIHAYPTFALSTRVAFAQPYDKP